MNFKCKIFNYLNKKCDFKSILTLITYTHKIHHQHDHLQYKNIAILKIFTIITQEDIKTFHQISIIKR